MIGTTHTTVKKQNDWILNGSCHTSGGKRNGKMSVVAVDIDAATIRLIEFQARKYQFGVIGLFCRRRRLSRWTLESKPAKTSRHLTAKRG